MHNPLPASIGVLAIARAGVGSAGADRRRSLRGAAHTVGRSRPAGPVEQPDGHSARAAAQRPVGREGDADGRRSRGHRASKPEQERFGAGRRGPRHLQFVLERCRQGLEPALADPRPCGRPRAGIHAARRRISCLPSATRALRTTRSTIASRCTTRRPTSATGPLHVRCVGRQTASRSSSTPATRATLR